MDGVDGESEGLRSDYPGAPVVINSTPIVGGLRVTLQIKVV